MRVGICVRGYGEDAGTSLTCPRCRASVKDEGWNKGEYDRGYGKITTLTCPNCYKTLRA